jgi:hypothetical protein
MIQKNAPEDAGRIHYSQHSQKHNPHRDQPYYKHYDPDGTPKDSNYDPDRVQKKVAYCSEAIPEPLTVQLSARLYETEQMIDEITKRVLYLNDRLFGTSPLPPPRKDMVNTPATLGNPVPVARPAIDQMMVQTNTIIYALSDLSDFLKTLETL